MGEDRCKRRLVLQVLYFLSVFHCSLSLVPLTFRYVHEAQTGNDLSLSLSLFIFLSSLHFSKQKPDCKRSYPDRQIIYHGIPKSQGTAPQFVAFGGLI